MYKLPLAGPSFVFHLAVLLAALLIGPFMSLFRSIQAKRAS